VAPVSFRRWDTHEGFPAIMGMARCHALYPQEVFTMRRAGGRRARVASWNDPLLGTSDLCLLANDLVQQQGGKDIEPRRAVMPAQIFYRDGPSIDFRAFSWFGR
jgi:hypothetical protein